MLVQLEAHPGLRLAAVLIFLALDHELVWIVRLPVASGGIHVWHMPALVTIFGDDACLQFGGGTLGHPWGNAAGAAANRTALEACVEDRNRNGVEGLEKRGGDVLREAARHSPELAAAMETWKEIKFEFDTVDKLDVAHK